jgi:pyrophosphatase PpaX
MRDYKAYLLDFDGTLFDTLDSLVGVYQTALRAIGLDCGKDDAAFYMHLSLSETCDYLKVTNPDDRKTFALKVMEALDYPQFVSLIKPYADVRPTLEGLRRRGKTLAIVSGNTERHIRLVLKEFHWEQYFAFVVGYSSDRRPKPFADPILFA